jgi:hypothetical protein
LWSSSLCSLLQPPVTSSFLGLNIPLSTLFSKSLSLCSSFNVRDQVSNPYRTAGKIIVLYTLIFMFLDSRGEDKVLLYLQMKLKILKHTSTDFNLSIVDWSRSTGNNNFYSYRLLIEERLRIMNFRKVFTVILSSDFFD